MSSLNVITQAIEEKAKAETNEILAQAQARYDEQIKNAEARAKEIKEEILKNASEQAEGTELMANANAEHRISQSILKKKSEIIADAMKKAEQYIYSMDDEEYWSLFMRMLEKFAKPEKSGEILISKKDRERMPEKVSKGIAGCNLTAAAEDAPILGGFILRYGKIEENCSVEAIFSDKKEIITDFLNEKLFG